MRVFRRPANPGRYKAVVLAVLVHIVLIGVLVVSFRWTSDDTRPSTRVIEATALKEQATGEPAPEVKRAEEEARKREAEAERRRAEAERQRQAELKRQQEEARRRQAEEQRARAETERKRREAEAAKKRAEEERKRREAQAAQKRAEEERRKREAEQALKESLAAEEQARAEAARAARAATEAEKYKALIRQKVSRNWSEPPGTGRGLECVVRVRVVPGGEVVSVKIAQSSGDAVFDSSVENAVYKSTPLPLPEDPSLFEYLREIEFTFRQPTG